MLVAAIGGALGGCSPPPGVNMGCVQPRIGDGWVSPGYDAPLMLLDMDITIEWTRAVLATQHATAAGPSYAVMEVEGANMVEHVPDDVLTTWLIEAGYDDNEDREAALLALDEAGFDMPAAWTKAPDSRLIEAGIGPGYINSLLAVFQAKMVAWMVERRGTAAFAQRVQGTTKTDKQRAEELVGVKHVPEAPVVTEESGYGCAGEKWRDYL